jgi:uncharacterized protein
MQDSHLHAEYFPLLFLTIASKVLNYPRGFPTKLLAGPSIAGTVEDCELNFARRALQKIKARLGVDTTERLLQLDIDEAKTFWDDALKKNTTGELKPAEVQLSVRGISAGEFLTWFHDRCAKRVPDTLAAEPELWVIASDNQGDQKIIENLGPWVSRTLIKFGPPSKPCQHRSLRDDYPFTR